MMTALHPLIAYGWYWGWWWWWWIVILFFLWWLLLPPFSYGRRWYGGYRAGFGGAPVAPLDWQSIESRFIESPTAGIAQADRTVADLMARARPSTGMAEEYRNAHAVAVKAQNGSATEEEMRAAMLQYRSLFDRLLPPG